MNLVAAVGRTRNPTCDPGELLESETRPPATSDIELISIIDMCGNQDFAFSAGWSALESVAGFSTTRFQCHIVVVFE
jgi:hypothetical protein